MSLLGSALRLKGNEEERERRLRHCLVYLSGDEGRRLEGRAGSEGRGSACRPSVINDNKLRDSYRKGWLNILRECAAVLRKYESD